MLNFKQLASVPQKLAPGHRTCAGCTIPIIIRTVLASTKSPLVVCSATGCLEVTTTIYPFTSWEVPFIHSAFENVAATISGVEAAYKALKRKGVIHNDKKIKFIAFGGDGGTYDIGLQSLSGALERGHEFVYVLYDNEAYMNTGVQRSSSTPYGASTTTTPVGPAHHGKEQWKKDIAKICVAHNIPYVAQASVHNLLDLSMKAEKAFNAKGPAVLIVLQPCPTGWKFPIDQAIKVAKIAVETRFWPLYEVENGKYKLNYSPPKDRPIIEYLRLQGRFKHLLLPENLQIIEKIQSHIDEEWKKLVKLSES